MKKRDIIDMTMSVKELSRCIQAIGNIGGVDVLDYSTKSIIVGYPTDDKISILISYSNRMVYFIKGCSVYQAVDYKHIPLQALDLYDSIIVEG